MRRPLKFISPQRLILPVLNLYLFIVLTKMIENIKFQYDGSEGVYLIVLSFHEPTGNKQGSLSNGPKELLIYHNLEHTLSYHEAGCCLRKTWTPSCELGSCID